MSASAEGVISTPKVAGTLELAQKLSGGSGVSLGGLGFGRRQQPGEVRCLEVLLVDRHVQDGGIGPVIVN